MMRVPFVSCQGESCNFLSTFVINPKWVQVSLGSLDHSCFLFNTKKPHSLVNVPHLNTTPLIITYWNYIYCHVYLLHKLYFLLYIITDLSLTGSLVSAFNFDILMKDWFVFFIGHPSGLYLVPVHYFQHFERVACTLSINHLLAPATSLINIEVSPFKFPNKPVNYNLPLHSLSIKTEV